MLNSGILVIEESESGMKIVILHLSDLHIASKAAIHMENVNALVQSLSVFNSFDGIIIAFSGDIAAKGQLNDYRLANRFIGSLAKEVLETYKLKPENIKILLAPGNHDMNRQISCQCSRSDAEAWYKTGVIDEHVSDELDRMDEFYQFADKQGCFIASDKKVFARKILFFRQDESNIKYQVETNLFNSALFSSDNDNGIHYLPTSALVTLNNPSSASFSLSIMHHSPDWYWPEQKVQLQEQLFCRSNLVLYGHEHYESAQQIQQNQHGITFIQAGGAWWEQNFSNSSYYAGVFDTVSRDYQQYKFVWHTAKHFYEHKDYVEAVLPYKCCNGSQLSPSSEYMKWLLADEKEPVCGNIARYFVFPKLKFENPEDYDGNHEIQTQDELINLIEANKQLMITGSGGTGKTTLLRMLFLSLSQKYTVLLCGTSEVSGKTQKNIVRETFISIYGPESEKFALFEQQPKKQKIIIIDNAHLIKPAHLTKLLQGLGQIFEHIIIASEKNNTFDIRERVCKELELEKAISECAISKFYADKRLELIRKVIEACAEDNTSTIEKLLFQIDNSLNCQNLAYKLDPDFIVRYASYYCTHIRELRTENINVFSKVFEASIEASIEPFLNDETVGQIKTALGDVAHYIHFGKHYPIGEADIESVVTAYAGKYDEPLKATRFLDIVSSANILVRCSDSLSYRFKNNDHLAYFAAEAINRLFNEGNENSEKELRQVVEYSCFGINPTILKFIAYTTGNIRIVELLMQQAISYVEDWPVYNIDNMQFSYLKNIKQDDNKIFSANSKKKEINAMVDNEKLLEQTKETSSSNSSDVIEIINIYDYNESDISKLSNQITRAVLQLNVISSCLTPFSHMMPGTIKRELIIALYNMPNQIFNKWATEVDNELLDIVDEFQKIQEPTSTSEARESIQKTLSAIQRISENLLLNLYYTVAKQSATPSTIENITNPRYVSNTNHRLERMMFYEQVDRWNDFINEAEELYKKTNDGMTKDLIKGMVYHMLIWSPSLPAPKRQYMIDKFGLASKRKEILLLNNQNV